MKLAVKSIMESTLNFMVKSAMKLTMKSAVKSGRFLMTSGRFQVRNGLERSQ